MERLSKDWKKRYAKKVLPAEIAVRKLRRGQRILIGSGAAQPQLLVEALTRRGSELTDTEIYHLMTLGDAPYTAPNFKHIFRHNAFFVGDNVRSAVTEGRADYTPVFLSEIPRLLQHGRIHLDVALIQVSPPDISGYCSCGVSVDIVKNAAENADLVIAEVNSNMPRTLGDSFIHANRIDYLVESDRPLLESLPSEPDETATRIGRNVASVIENGSTLQLGVGSIPHAVLQFLEDKQDLGMHTEMFSDGIIPLIESGILNGAQKTLFPRKIVASFCMGTQELYQYVHDNPMFEFCSVAFTNDPFVIAQNDKMVAINSALEIDLTGQVCSDSIGYNVYSGIGGQVDFIRGAARSKNGKPIIVLRSTAEKDTISRIVPHLREGSGVVTSRGDIHYVVTEYGVADLWGKNLRERALALISIAHPKFRESLLASAKQHRLVYEDQILVSGAAYPKELETEITFSEGCHILFRPVLPTDEPLVKEMFYSLSKQSIFQRFMHSLSALPHARLQKQVNVDYQNQMNVVGIVKREDEEIMVAMGEYIMDPATRLGDAAFLVRDEYQGMGIGTFLLSYLARIARQRGVPGFTADVLPENQRMLHIFYKSGYELKSTLQDGVYHLEFLFNASPGKDCQA